MSYIGQILDTQVRPYTGIHEGAKLKKFLKYAGVGAGTLLGAALLPGIGGAIAGGLGGYMLGKGTGNVLHRKGNGKKKSPKRQRRVLDRDQDYYYDYDREERSERKVKKKQPKPKPEPKPKVEKPKDYYIWWTDEQLPGYYATRKEAKEAAEGKYELLKGQYKIFKRGEE